MSFVIEVEDVQRDLGVLHPVRLRLLGVMNEQHAVIGIQGVAKHEAARPFGIAVGDFDRIAMTLELDPDARTGAGAARKHE